MDLSAQVNSNVSSNLEATLLATKKLLKSLINSTKIKTDKSAFLNSEMKLFQRALLEEDEHNRPYNNTNDEY